MKSMKLILLKIRCGRFSWLRFARMLIVKFVHLKFCRGMKEPRDKNIHRNCSASVGPRFTEKVTQLGVATPLYTPLVPIDGLFRVQARIKRGLLWAPFINYSENYGLQKFETLGSTVHIREGLDWLQGDPNRLNRL